MDWQAPIDQISAIAAGSTRARRRCGIEEWFFMVASRTFQFVILARDSPPAIRHHGGAAKPNHVMLASH
jgi:hypothetical protein